MQDLQIVQQLPNDLKPEAIDKAVKDFISDTEIDVNFKLDRNGFYHQTLEAIASSTYFKTPGRFFWLAWHDGEVLAYCLSNVGRDVDGKLTYHLEQAWVRKDVRRHPIVKQWYEKFREHAKQLMCKHITVTSCRNNEAYLRFLGKNWHKFYAVLKEDI